MLDGIMTKLGLGTKACENKVGEASRVKKSDETLQSEKAPDKLVRSPKKDTFTSSNPANQKSE